MNTRGGAVSTGARSAAARLPEGKSRGGAWRRDVARGGRANRGVGWAKQAEWRATAAQGSRWVGKLTAAAACRAPAELEVEYEF